MGFNTGDLLQAIGPNIAQSLNPAGVRSLITVSKTLPAFKLNDGTPVNNSASLTNDTDLTIAINANEVWVIICGLYWTSSTANLKFDLAGPASPTLVSIGSNVGGFPGSNVVSRSFSSGLLSQNNSGLASGNCIFLFALVKNGANSGNITVQTAQWAPLVEDTILKAGSFLLGFQIG